MPVEGPDRRFMSMITYLGGAFNVCGEKWYGSNVRNPEERRLPRSIHLVVLNDPLTGAPLAVMDGTLLSAMRTGAVVGLGAKYLAAKESRVAGIVGAGVISKTSLLALSVPLGNLKEVKVFDIVRSKAESFSGEMSQKLGINVHPVDTLEESVRGSDVIASAPSGIKKASYAAAWFKKGSFFAISSDAEVEDEIWFDCRGQN